MFHNDAIKAYAVMVCFAFSWGGGIAPQLPVDRLAIGLGSGQIPTTKQLLRVSAQRRSSIKAPSSRYVLNNCPPEISQDQFRVYMP